VPLFSQKVQNKPIHITTKNAANMNLSMYTSQLKAYVIPLPRNEL